MPDQPPVTVSALTRWGRDLHRPECVLATSDGDVFVPDWRGGVSVVRADGSQHSWIADPPGIELQPNGIALAADGSFLVANLADAGGVYRLDRNNVLTPFLTDVDGVSLPPANFVTIDAHGRTWISASTRLVPRQQAWNRHTADGFVVLVDERGARIVADGLHYTNEVRPDPSGEWLYVVETFGRRLQRFRIRPDGSLQSPEVVVTLGHGNFPDGFAFDEDSGLWITSLVSNRLLRLIDDRIDVVFEDVNPDFVSAAESAFQNGTMTREHLGPIPGAEVQQLTSVAFGGRDGRDVFLGSLHTPYIHRFRAAVAGV